MQHFLADSTVKDTPRCLFHFTSQTPFYCAVKCFFFPKESAAQAQQLESMLALLNANKLNYWNVFVEVLLLRLCVE